MNKVLHKFYLDLSWQGVEVMAGDWNDESYIGHFQLEMWRVIDGRRDVLTVKNGEPFQLNKKVWEAEQVTCQ